MYQMQEVNDVKQKEVDGEAKSDGKEESPPLPSPQQVQMHHFFNLINYFEDLINESSLTFLT